MAKCEHIEACRRAYGGEGCEPACDLGFPCHLYEPKVDLGALSALADELDSLGLSGFSSGWSSGAVNVGYLARRIREALGVDDR